MSFQNNFFTSKYFSLRFDYFNSSLFLFKNLPRFEWVSGNFHRFALVIFFFYSKFTSVNDSIVDDCISLFFFQFNPNYHDLCQFKLIKFFLNESILIHFSELRWFDEFIEAHQFNWRVISTNKCSTVVSKYRSIWWWDILSINVNE